MRELLPDMNLLIALTWRDHVLHDRAQRWFAEIDSTWATATQTENGFIRVSMNPRVTSQAVGWSTALNMLTRIRSTPGHQWWGKEVDLAESELVRRAPVVGYRQVADVCLAALAAHHNGRLATLDKGVVDALHPKDRGIVTVVEA